MASTIAQFTGKVYPDKSFSIGRIPRKQKGISERRYDRDYTDQFDSFTEVKKTYKGVEVSTYEWLDGKAHASKFNKSPESSQKSKTYGSHGITRFGRRVVKNGAILLERKYGIRRLGFVTCTIPAFDSATIKVVARNWGEITRRFFQKVKRHQEKMGQPLEIICCTEIQEKRYRKFGDIAPHLHFIYVCKQRAHEKKFNIVASLLRRYWQESMSQVIQKVQGGLDRQVSFSASVNAQVINKSASSYLGKYMSKGGAILAELKEKGLEEYFPSQWWTASSLMKKMFKESVVYLDNDACSFIFYNLGEHLAEGVITWCSFVDIEINNEYRTVGCVGVFSEEYYKLLQ